MKLKEIFDQLSHGELVQLHLGGEGDTTGVTEASYDRMLSHINLGLTALHKRFRLKEGTVVLVPQENMLYYKIHSRFQEGNRISRETLRYLAPQPVFKDDLLRIEKVSVNGIEYPLNSDAHPASFFTPSFDQLVLPEGLPEGLPKTDGIVIKYRQNHPLIERGIGLFRPECIEVDLPYTHLEALLLFIASRVMNPVGITQEFHEGNNYAALYEAECLRLENQNFRVDQGYHNDRLHRNGWA